MNLEIYPGTTRHQAFLQAITTYYAEDERIRAICVFGSLGRGNWDQYSDLDLDVIVADGIKINVLQELHQLCRFLALIGEKVALIIPDGQEEGDMVFESLMEISIRYHTLHTTSPNIVDSLQCLAGQIDLTTIQAAGLANRTSNHIPASRLLDKCLRYALEVDVALQRGRLWGAIELLHRMRGLLMQLYTTVHNGVRPRHFFEAHAPIELQKRLASTLPTYEIPSCQSVLATFLDILESEIASWTSGEVQLNEAQHKIIQKIRRTTDH